MSLKRRNTSSPEPEDHPIKRRSISYEYDSDDSDLPDVNQKPQINATTGQSGAFPGLGNDDELFYGPAADGIDYLRMVRSERKDIPELLTTIQPPTENELHGGYWQDGAYTAQSAPLPERKETFSNAQSRYYDELCERFSILRDIINSTPPLHEIEVLGTERPISFPSEQRAATYTWDEQISQKLPHPVQLACMDASSVFEVIRLITKRLGHYVQRGDEESTRRVGAWAWALLGRCPERGQLGSEEISDLRAFAQRAREVVHRMETEGTAAGQGVLHDDGDDADMEIEEIEMDAGPETDSISVSTAKLASTEKDDQSSIDSTKEITNSKGISDAAVERYMLVDMILTVVGEVYGQRDLLELRRPWTVGGNQ